MTTTRLEPSNTEVAGPGVYDLDERLYLADPVPEGSLSASGAKLMLRAPALFRHRQLIGEEHADHFDFGKAAHAKVLGAGADVVVLEFNDWKTKAAREARDDVRADGATPILMKDWAKVCAMAAELERHPIANTLLRQPGRVEQTMIWHDRIWRRSRVDYLPDLPDTGRLIVPDYKTTADASVNAFSRSVANFGYFMSAAWYLDGIRSLLGADDAAFVLIAQEKDPPHLVNVVEMTADFLAIGDWRNERAVDRYIACTESGEWPGYPPEVQRISAPRWLELEHEEQVEMQQEGITTW